MTRQFAVTLLDSHGVDHFDAVTRFVAADNNGSFGLLPGHTHLVALLRYGLARFIDSSGANHYVALPGGVLRFKDNQLTVTCMRYFLGDQRDDICECLTTALAKTDSEIHTVRARMTEIEHSLVRRLAELGSSRPGRY